MPFSLVCSHNDGIYISGLCCHYYGSVDHSYIPTSTKTMHSSGSTPRQGLHSWAVL